MSNFKVGQKVVCVHPVKDLIKNEIYKILRLRNCKCGILGIEVNKNTSISGTVCYCGFKSNGWNDWTHDRFRPLDHQFGEDVCAAITEQVKQEQLIESL